MSGTLLFRNRLIRNRVAHNTIDELDAQVAQGGLQGHAIAAVSALWQANDEDVLKLQHALGPVNLVGIIRTCPKRVIGNVVEKRGSLLERRQHLGQLRVTGNPSALAMEIKKYDDEDAGRCERPGKSPGHHGSLAHFSLLVLQETHASHVAWGDLRRKQNRVQIKKTAAVGGACHGVAWL